MPLQTEILQESFHIIALHGTTFSTAFYTRLFADYPEVRPLFANISLEEQQQKFLMMIVLIIEHLNKPDILEVSIRQLGQRHEGYGIEPEHYAMVEAALINVLAEFSGQHWNSQWEAAWRDAYQTIVGVMQGTHSLLSF